MAIKLLHGKGKIWPEITALTKKSPRNLVAVAFLSKGARKLLPLRPGDTLLVDMSVERVKTGATNPFAVREFFEAGVSVFTRRGLHAKVFVLGNRVVVGSTNVSSAADSRLDEAALSTGEKAIIKASEKFIEELRDQEGTLPVTELLLKKCEKQFKPSNWHGGVPDDEPEESWSLGMMRQIAPKSVITSRGSPHIEPTNWKAIRRIYLKDSDGTVVLNLYPGDVKGQAEPFYERLNIEKLDGLVSRIAGWEGRPNFHLGYRAKNLDNTYTKTSGKLELYLKFWKRPPADLRIEKAKMPNQYARLVRDLMRHGMIRASDAPGVKYDIKNRKWVSLRPGVNLTFTWDTKLPTAKEIKAKINEALETWGESVVARGSGKSRQLVMVPVE